MAPRHGTINVVESVADSPTHHQWSDDVASSGSTGQAEIRPAPVVARRASALAKPVAAKTAENMGTGTGDDVVNFGPLTETAAEDHDGGFVSFPGYTDTRC